MHRLISIKYRFNVVIDCWWFWPFLRTRILNSTFNNHFHVWCLPWIIQEGLKRHKLRVKFITHIQQYSRDRFLPKQVCNHWPISLDVFVALFFMLLFFLLLILLWGSFEKLFHYRAKRAVKSNCIVVIRGLFTSFRRFFSNGIKLFNIIPNVDVTAIYNWSLHIFCLRSHLHLCSRTINRKTSNASWRH